MSDQLLNDLTEAVRAERVARAALEVYIENELKRYTEAVDGALRSASGAGVSVGQIADAMGTTNRSGVRERIRRLNESNDSFATSEEPELATEPAAIEGVNFRVTGEGELNIVAVGWGPRNVTGTSDLWFVKDDGDPYFGPNETVYDKNMEVIDQIGHAVQIEDKFYIEAIRTWLEANA